MLTRRVVECLIVVIGGLGMSVITYGQVIGSGTDLWAYCTWPTTCPSDQVCTNPNEICWYCTDPQSEGKCEFAWTTDCNWAVWGTTNGCGSKRYGVCPGPGWLCTQSPHSDYGHTCTRFACWTVE